MVNGVFAGQASPRTDILVGTDTQAVNDCHGLIFILVCVFWSGCAGCGEIRSPAEQATERPTAQAQFLAFATTTRKAGIGYDSNDPYGVTRAWRKCFEHGDLASPCGSGFPSVLDPAIVTSRNSSPPRHRMQFRRILPILDVPVGPVEHLGQHVQDRFTGAVAVALVRQHDQPRGAAIALDRLEQPLRLDGERAGVVVGLAVDQAGSAR